MSVTTFPTIEHVAPVLPDLAAVERAIAGASVVKPTHRTPYGSTEVYVREPGGHTIGFAQS